MGWKPLSLRDGSSALHGPDLASCLAGTRVSSHALVHYSLNEAARRALETMMKGYEYQSPLSLRWPTG